MPPQPINPQAILDNAINGVVGNFIHEGLIALPVIGTALLGLAGLFVIFYWTARAFGWKLKRPTKKSKPGIVGNPNKAHFEKSESLFSWWRNRNVVNAVFDGGISPNRPSSPIGGFARGVTGFGDAMIGSGMPSDYVDDDWDFWHDGFTDGNDYADADIDAEDARSGWYADPSFYAPWTDDSGPDAAPGRQNGGFSGSFEDRQSFSSETIQKVSGGLVYGIPLLGISEHLNNSLYSGLLIDSQGNPSWYELWSIQAYNPDCTPYMPSQMMRDVEDAWEKMYGWKISLAPDESYAQSAETTFHALRIMEMTRMREMGFTGTPEQFMQGLAEFEGMPDDDPSDTDFDFDRGAYDH